MNELSPCSTRRMRPVQRMGSLGAAGFALALAACAHTGIDDVKPTATTAYHSGAAAAQPPSSAASAAPARE